MKARDLLVPFERHIGCDYMHWPDGGFPAGSPDTEIQKVLLTWRPTLRALRQAADLGCNVVFCHEGLYTPEKPELPPYRWLTPMVEPPAVDAAPDDMIRRIIADHRVTVVQSHYGWDRFCMYDAFCDALGLSAPVYDHGWESVFELPRPTQVRDLCCQVKDSLEISGTVRLAGDPDMTVRRIVNLWGGMGLSANMYWINRALANGAEAGICGEMDEVFINYALDAGFPVIETSHQLSEEFGVRYHADYLRRHYPELRLEVFTPGRPYQTV